MRAIVQLRSKASILKAPALGSILLCFGCASLGPVPAGAAPASGSPMFEAAYLEIRLLMAEARVDEATKKLETFVARDDCPPEFHLALAEARMEKRDVQGAIRALGDCLEKHPGFVPALRQRSRLNRLRGETDAAAEDLRKALEREPTNPSMLEDLGMLLLRQAGRPRASVDPGDARRTTEELTDVYRRLLDARRGSDRVMPLLVLASIHAQTGEHEKAIVAAKEAVEIQPQDVRTQVALAEAYEAAQKRPEALEAYRQAMLVEPDNPQLRAKTAELIRLTGAPGGMLGFYEELAKSFPRVREIQEAYGQELLKAGKWAEAADTYEKALVLWPGDATLEAALVRALFGSGREDEALERARRLAADPEAGAAVVIDLAASLRQHGKLDEVVELLRRLAKEQNGDYRIVLQIASVQIESNKPDEAVETLEALVADKPEVFLAVAMLGGLYAERGDFAEAHALYDRALATAPAEGRADLLQLKADLFRKEGKTDEAVAILTALVDESKTPPESAMQLLLQILEDAKDFPRAHAVVDRLAAKLEGDALVQARRMKAYLHWRNDEYDEAIAILEPLARERSDDFALFTFLAETYMDADRAGEALALLDAGGDRFDERFSTEVRLLRARAHKIDGEFPKAIGVIEELLAEHPDEERFHLIAGEYYHLSGDIDSAEKVLRKAIALDPSNPESYNALGYFLAEAGVKLPEALALVEKALELSPDSGHILDSLGWVHFRLGDFDKAVEALESAALRMADSPDPVVLEHLGDAYAKQGRGDKAREQYEAALKLNPKSETVREKLGL